MNFSLLISCQIVKKFFPPCELATEEINTKTVISYCTTKSRVESNKEPSTNEQNDQILQPWQTAFWWIIPLHYTVESTRHLAIKHFTVFKRENQVANEYEKILPFTKLMNSSFCHKTFQMDELYKRAKIFKKYDIIFWFTFIIILNSFISDKSILAWKQTIYLVAARCWTKSFIRLFWEQWTLIIYNIFILGMQLVCRLALYIFLQRTARLVPQDWRQCRKSVTSKDRAVSKSRLDVRTILILRGVMSCDSPNPICAAWKIWQYNIYD